MSRATPEELFEQFMADGLASEHRRDEAITSARLATAELTSCRDNGRKRPKGYAAWRPQAKSRVLVEQVQEILSEYVNYLPLTVRQIYYVLVGQYGYAKTEQAYEVLCDKLVRARRARMIPFSSIRDDGVMVMQERWYSGQQDFFEQYARDADLYRRDRQQGQPYRIELWAEAAGMLPQLARVAHEYSIPVYSASGFTGITGVRSIVDRARNASGKTVLLHVGDYDPSGVAIFEAMTSDAQAFLAEDRILAVQEIIPVRVALTGEQVEGYGLETTPPKRNDSRSGRWQGDTCQLEALRPDDLALIVEGAILEWVDEDRLQHEVGLENDDRVALLRALPRGAA